MKKLLFTLSAAFLCLFLMCSCGEEAFPYADAESKFLFGDSLFYTNSDHLLAYRTADGNESLLCYDPLCSHDSMDCHAYSFGRSDLAAVMGKNGTPIVFYTAEYMDFENNIRTYRIYRLDMASGERTAVLSDQSEAITDFAIYGDHIYIKMQCTQYDDDGKTVSIGNNLFSMKTDGTDFRQLTTFADNSVQIVGITGEYDAPTIYWMDYADEQSLYASPADFSEKIKLMSNLTLMGNFIDGDYLYYSVKTDETADALTVSAHPDDKNASADGSITIRAETKKTACYRLHLTEANSAPELLYTGILEPTSNRKTLYVHENKAYIIPYEPMYLETIAATMKGETGDLVSDLAGGSLEIDYITADSGAKLLVLDLDKKDIVTIETHGFDPQAIVGVSDGILHVTGMVTDGDRIREKLAAEGVRSNSFAFGEERQVALP